MRRRIALLLIVMGAAVLFAAGVTTAETSSGKKSTKKEESLEKLPPPKALEKKQSKDEPDEASKEAAVEDLLPKAQSEGSVRVIVGLQADFPQERFLPEGELSRSEVAEQQSAIGTAQEGLAEELRGTGAKTLHEYETIPYMVLELPPEALEALQRSPRVTSFMEDKFEPLPQEESVPADKEGTNDEEASTGEEMEEPFLASSVPIVQADDMWAAGRTGSGQTVAVLDTGIEKTHSFLTGKVVDEACFSLGSDGTVNGSGNCPNGTESQTGSGSGVPCTYSTLCGHGTHVGGIAAGKGTLFSGVAKDASLMSVQVFSRNPNTGAPGSFPSDQIKGLEQVYNLRATRSFASVNMSLGGGRFFSNCDTDARKPIIDNLKSAGIATVIATGNEGFTDSTGVPACISSAVSVGSTTDLDTVSSFSNSASFIHLLAPGSSIDSSVPGGGFAGENGTSMATPHVAGAYALLKQAHPSQTVDRIRTALQNTGKSVTDNRAGGGVTKPRINIFDASTSLGGGGGGDTIRPIIQSSFPTPFQRRMPTKPVMTANFSEPMNTSTLSANFNIQLYRYPSGPRIDVTAVPSADGKSVGFFANTKLKKGKVYQIVFWNDAASGIKDVAGNRLAGDSFYQQHPTSDYVYWIFKTRAR